MRIAEGGTRRLRRIAYQSIAEREIEIPLSAIGNPQFIHGYCIPFVAT
jgi:hypothetical protein